MRTKNKPLKKSELRPGLIVVSTDWNTANIWTIAEVSGNAVYVLGDGFERDGVYRPNHSTGWADYSGFYHPTVEQIQAYLDEGRRIIDRETAQAELERVRRIVGRSGTGEDLLEGAED